MAKTTSKALAFLAAVGTAFAATGTIKDVNHIVLFMQENRAFDHYFGLMAGVRGFNDPNVQKNPDGNNTFQQILDSSLTTQAKVLYPWYLNYLGGTWPKATQCMVAGSNGWGPNHAAVNGDLNNNWPLANTPWSWGHFARSDIPAHYAIAEGWTVGDMYQEGVMTSTDPNRATWMSGTISTSSNLYIDNNESPGCEGTNLNCYPLTWKTIPEYWNDAGVSWQVYQDSDNFDDNSLAWFKQYQSASTSSDLYTKGLAKNGLKSFYDAAAAGKLPMISIIVGPAELSEHPPYQPRDGAWLQSRITNAVTSSPAYNSTALIISYDETGGWGDHVTPIHSPSGTSGEWIQDPYGKAGYTYIGPGLRLPFYIVSPWTRGGNVYTESSDHTSQIQFVETWLTAKGYSNIKTDLIPAWRRANMANLTLAFDFAHPDYTLPNLPNITYPSTDSKGNWNGYSVCENTYSTTRPPVPYSAQNTTQPVETGFKKVRGQLTEGRFLVFESSGSALAYSGTTLTASTASAKHDTAAQRFVIQSKGNGVFSLLGASGRSSVGDYTISYMPSAVGYSLKSTSSGSYVAISSGKITTSSSPYAFSAFSVSY